MAGERLYQGHDIEEHLIRSRIVAETFRIRVLQPVSRIDNSETFPVIYVTDADEFFGGLATLASNLQGHGEIPRFILVGIGYENGRAAGLLRMRDLLTHSVRERFGSIIEQLSTSPLFDGVVDRERITHTTDASDFLLFIRQELMPLVATRYRVLSGENSYFGYSAGGTFGLNTLFTQPDAFKHYVLGSPGTSINGYHFGLELPRAFVETKREINARLFMSVGDLEEFNRGLDQFDLVTGFYLFAKYLNAAPIPGLECTWRIFPGETHATAWAQAFSQGLRTLLGPVRRVPFWPAYFG